MAILKQNTAYTRQFLTVLSSDHITGATVGSSTMTVNLGKAGAAAVSLHGTVAIVDSSNLPGVYKLNLDTVDTNTIGDLSIGITAATCDPVTFIDQVQSQVFTDLNMSGTGRVSIADNLQQNATLSGFTFMMVNSTTGQRQSGLTVTAQRTLGGGGFAPCTNTVSEVGSTGIYTINFSAADLNSSVVGFLFTAPTAADLFIQQIPTP